MEKVDSKMAFSARGMTAQIMPEPDFSGGADAEEYEKRNYNARYETRRFEQTCTAVSDLKEGIVFQLTIKQESCISIF